MTELDLSDYTFRQIQQWLYAQTGIFLNDNKMPLVHGRLQKRLRELQLVSLDKYARLLLADKLEQQVAINLLTTNETYFFREPKHFEFLLEVILPQIKHIADIKVWSAASSTGEEAYTIALLLAEHLGIKSGWQITGTDINTEVLGIAAQGVYLLTAAEKIPELLRKKYCVKGKNKDSGWFRLGREVREHVSFQQLNLMKISDFAKQFDVVFLRNVLIYFELTDKQLIIRQVLTKLKPGGWLLVGHSESITGYDPRLKQYKPGCYRYEP